MYCAFFMSHIVHIGARERFYNLMNNVSSSYGLGRYYWNTTPRAWTKLLHLLQDMKAPQVVLVGWMHDSVSQTAGHISDGRHGGAAVSYNPADTPVRAVSIGT